jgi:hypothetical protein
MKLIFPGTKYISGTQAFGPILIRIYMSEKKSSKMEKPVTVPAVSGH